MKNIYPFYPRLEQRLYYDKLPYDARQIYDMIHDQYRKGNLESEFLDRDDLDKALYALMLDDPCFFLPLEGRVTPTRIRYDTGHPDQRRYHEILSELWISHSAGPVGDLDDELRFYNHLINVTLGKKGIEPKALCRAKLLQYVSNLLDMRCFIFVEEDGSVIAISDLTETI